MDTLLPTQKPLPGTPLQLGDWSVNGQKGYWPFNEGAGTKAFDLSRNGNTGTITGATWTAGKFGSELNFDGGDYVVIPEITQIHGISGLTIVLWASQNILDAGEHFYSFGTSISNRIRLLSWTDGKLYVEICGTTNRGYFDYSTAVTAGKLHQFIIRFDGSGSGNAGRLKFYVDSIERTLIYSGTIPAATGTNSGFSFILGAYNDYTYLLNGKESNLMIFNRALSVSEMSQLHREPFRASMHQEMGVFELPSQTAAGVTMSSYYYNHFLGAAA